MDMSSAWVEKTIDTSDAQAWQPTCVCGWSGKQMHSDYTGTKERAYELADWDRKDHLLYDHGIG